MLLISYIYLKFQNTNKIKPLKASLRQLEHVIDIDVLQIELSKKSENEKGLNVVVTSTSSKISQKQRKDIEDAVDIGRVLATCFDEKESVESVISRTSLSEKIYNGKTEQKDARLNSKNLPMSEAGALTLEMNKEEADQEGTVTISLFKIVKPNAVVMDP